MRARSRALALLGARASAQWCTAACALRRQRRLSTAGMPLHAYQHLHRGPASSHLAHREHPRQASHRSPPPCAYTLAGRCCAAPPAVVLYPVYYRDGLKAGGQEREERTAKRRWLAHQGQAQRAAPALPTKSKPHLYILASKLRTDNMDPEVSREQNTEAMLPCPSAMSHSSLGFGAFSFPDPFVCCVFACAHPQLKDQIAQVSLGSATLLTTH